MEAELDAARKAGLLDTFKAGTLSAFVDSTWLPSIQALSPLSVRRYTDAYRKHIEPKLGPTPLTSINPTAVRQWYDALNATNATKDHAKSILGQILNMASDLELIASNPTKKVKTKTAKKDPRERILSNAETIELLQAVKGLSIEAPVTLAATLGLRRGEVCGFRWSNISPDGLIKVSEQYQVIYTPEGMTKCHNAPKRGKRRAFYVPPQLLELIKSVGNLDHSHVCTVDGHIWRPDTLTRRWSEFAKEYKPEDGYPLKDWTFHDLRHLAVGLLRRAGVDYLTIRTICGHSTTEQTLEYMAMEAKETIGAFTEILALTRPNSST